MGRISKQGPLRQVEPAMPERPTPAGSEIVLYQTEDGQSRIAVRLEGDTVWLTQRQLAELFQVAVPTVNEHISNIVETGECDPGATIRKFRMVQTEGGRLRRTSRSRTRGRPSGCCVIPRWSTGTNWEAEAVVDCATDRASGKICP